MMLGGKEVDIDEEDITEVYEIRSHPTTTLAFDDVTVKYNLLWKR